MGSIDIMNSRVFYLLLLIMYKHLFRTVLWTVWILVMLSLWVVNAQETCGSWYVLNAAWTGCELIQVTFDANGWSFSGGDYTKTVNTTVVEVPPIRYSHTENINDDWVASSVYANNLSTNDIVTIPWATSLDIEVRFSTEGAWYDWLAIYPAGITPTSSNYSSATISNWKLAWHGSYSSYTRPSDTDTTYHRNFTVSWDTAQFYFKSDSSSAYYGYFATIWWVWAPNTYECEYNIPKPKREWYAFQWWYMDEEFTYRFDTTECLLDNTTVYAKWKEVNPKDIVIEATATQTGQKIKINKYFANAYTVDWWDGTTWNLTADATHTYTWVRTYTIILSTTANRWTFQNVTKPLVPTNGTTVTWVKVIYMPLLTNWFWNSLTGVGDYFFKYFNWNWALTELPEWSFDTSNIIEVWISFFDNFNRNGKLTSLPEWSFDTSNITNVGDYFFRSFNYDGNLINLPEWSFDISSITTLGAAFFSRFNYGGKLTSLPEYSFDTSNLTNVGDYFFYNFNAGWRLTSLPEHSFDTSNLTNVGDYFFAYFNDNWRLKSLPQNSFNTSSISVAWNYFFSNFNKNWTLISLPEWSFNLLWIETAKNNFFLPI